MKKFLPLALCLLLLLTACGGDGDRLNSGAATRGRAAVESGELQFQPVVDGGLVADIETSLGGIQVVLYPQHAPRAVENFKRLAAAGYYNNTEFHRVTADFAIQGGDPTGTGEGGADAWGAAAFPNEIREDLRHYSGALCMAGQGDKQVNGSQFYIVATPQGVPDEEALAQLTAAGWREGIVETYRQAGGAPYLDNTDTVFGQVVSGMEVVDKIASVDADEDGRPKTPVTVISVTIGAYAAPAGADEGAQSSQVANSAAPPAGSEGGA